MGNRNGLAIVPTEGATKNVIPAPPKPRQYRLTNARAIRRELAVLYAELRNGEIDSDMAKTGAYLLRTILEALRTDEIEIRIDELEGMR